jgi:hypothetical protein
VSVLVRLAAPESSPVDVASFSPLGRLASSLRSANWTDGAGALRLPTTGPTTTLERCTKHFAW